MSQRSFVGVVVWNEPLPLTLVGTTADPSHSGNIAASSDPLLFLAGATAPGTGPAAAAGAAGGVAALAAATAASGGSLSLSLDGELTSAPNGGYPDAESRDRAAVLRLLQLQNVSLTRVARSAAQTAHALEVRRKVKVGFRW